MKKPVEHEEIPMTWVSERDPLWDQLAARWGREEDEKGNRAAHRKGQPLAAVFSKQVDISKCPGGFFRTSWLADIWADQPDAEIKRPMPSMLPRIGRNLKDSAAHDAMPSAEPWRPIRSGQRSETITAMEHRWDRGAVKPYEYETYAETLKATAAVLADDDPDRGRCLVLATRVEEQIKLFDEAFVRKAWKDRSVTAGLQRFP